MSADLFQGASDLAVAEVDGLLGLEDVQETEYPPARTEIKESLAIQPTRLGSSSSVSMCWQKDARPTKSLRFLRTTPGQHAPFRGIVSSLIQEKIHELEGDELESALETIQNENHNHFVTEANSTCTRLLNPAKDGAMHGHVMDGTGSTYFYSVPSRDGKMSALRTSRLAKMRMKMLGTSTAKISPSGSLQDPWVAKAEERVLRKCDIHVLPILFTLYMLSYLDRINIGNARIENLESDLGMSGNDYNIAVQVFFIPYILLEVPSNIALRHVAPSTWLSVIMFFWGTCTSTYSVSYYLPTVLNELGYKASDAQVQTIPIYAAALVLAFITAWISDRLRHRFSFVILGAAVNVIGYSVLLAQASTPVKIKYMALYFVVCGLWIGSPVEIVWISSNLGGHYKRAIGSAIQVATGNMSGFVAGNVFIADQAPRYPVGYGVALAMSGFAAAAATILFLGLKRENKRRERGERDSRLRASCKKEDNLGDDHPGFRYGL
ncbi:MAG: hypothetical protein Q9166_005242 [cf. Caloplaca sp. 2 TL-2023]